MDTEYISIQEKYGKSVFNSIHYTYTQILSDMKQNFPNFQSVGLNLCS